MEYSESGFSSKALLLTRDLELAFRFGIIQLRSSQELYLAAQNEATQTATPAITRRYSTRPRRKSTAGSNVKPFLGGNSIKG